MSVAISINNISKAYQLGTFNTGSFTTDLARWWALKRGKEDPFLQIGEENDRTAVSKGNIIWSLKDISFDIEQGDSVGIIGSNGAGKSTLLKILSQVTHPTAGQLRIKGKVASLLEVGTGFHPELTGRENVFLNGAILGMRKTEIKQKFDEIVDFSGVERYIDTPVKRYSSGMYVRLAFAVAAHLDSDILIVDEVLAVGDVEFQKKCIGKMNDVTGLGKTVLFVSHNLGSVRSICNSVIVIDKGKSVFNGRVDEGIKYYLNGGLGIKKVFWTPPQDKVIGNKFCNIKRISLKNSLKQENQDFNISEAINIFIEYEILERGYKAMFSVVLFDEMGTILFGSINNLEPQYFNKALEKGQYVSECHIPGNLLNEGVYYISLIGMSSSKTDAFTIEHALKINAHDDGILKKGYEGNYGGFFRPKLEWSTFQKN
jgi:ABC-type polysaccharide/polyol phosphate transport system ATPase subunit